MKKNIQNRLFKSPILLGIVILGAACLLALVGYRLVTGKSLNLRTRIYEASYYFIDIPKILANSGKIRGQEGSFNNVVFLHQSVGKGIINGGHLRDLLKDKGYQFWDQGYRDKGLRDPDGKHLGFTYDIPNDNTDPDGLYNIFSQDALDMPVNGLSQLLQHDIIMLKSCYPISDIRDEAQFKKYQAYYLGMRDTFDKHPDKLFILLTQPPLNPAATDAETAKRARALANWLKSEEYVGGHPNLAVFDLFDIWAVSDQTHPDANMLREEYQREGDDSHPNDVGNEAAAKPLADFIAEKASAYQKTLLALDEN